MNTKKMNTRRNKMTEHLKLLPFIIVLLFIFSSCHPTYVVQQPSPSSPPPPPPQPVVQTVAPPPWAPVYDNEQQVHYYYLPDIGVYYDVWRQQYIYNDNGEWFFSPSLPQSYDWYDINDAYVVVLGYQTYNPWMQHNYYVSSYPAYYYRNNPNYVNGPGGPNGGGYMRGYNENAQTMMYNNRPSNPGPRNRNREDYMYNRRPSPPSQPSSPERPDNYHNQGQSDTHQLEQRNMNTNVPPDYKRPEENARPGASQSNQRPVENARPGYPQTNQRTEESTRPNNPNNQTRVNPQPVSNTQKVQQPLSNTQKVQQPGVNNKKTNVPPPHKVNPDNKGEEKKDK